MSTDRNKEAFRHIVEDVQSAGGDLSELDTLMAENYSHHDPSLPPELQSGREAYKQLIGMFHSAFPDMTGHVEEPLIAEGNIVAGRWTYSGTQQGELMGIPPTGRHVSISGMNMARFDDDGTLVEGWVLFDSAGMMQQLGVMGAPGE